MGSQNAHSNNRRESNYTELSLTIWLTGDILNCNRIKDCIIFLETFENEIDYPFS